MQAAPHRPTSHDSNTTQTPAHPATHPPPTHPQPAAVKSIHYKRLPVTQVVAGQTAAVALKKVKKSQVGPSPLHRAGADGSGGSGWSRRVAG